MRSSSVQAGIFPWSEKFEIQLFGGSPPGPGSRQTYHERFGSSRLERDADEPLVLVRGVVGDPVEDHAQAAPVRLLDERVGVGKRAEGRVDVRVVAYVVAEVRHRRAVEGREPEGVDAQIHEMVEAGGDSGEVAHAVAVRVGEGARIDLVDDAGAPPRGFLRRHGARG